MIGFGRRTLQDRLPKRLQAVHRRHGRLGFGAKLKLAHGSRHDPLIVFVCLTDKGGVDRPAIRFRHRTLGRGCRRAGKWMHRRFAAACRPH